MINQQYQHAEEAVLGSILIEGELIKECQLKPKSFANQHHQRIFEAMLEIVEKDIPVDVVSVTVALGDRLQDIGGVAYLAQLADAVPTTETFKYYQGMVIEGAKTRIAQSLVAKFAENPSGEEIQPLIDRLTKLEERSIQKNHKTKKQLLRDVVEHMYSSYGVMSGVPSGLHELDAMTGGWQKQDLIIVAARPSMGKTAFALNLGANNCKNSGITSLFSLEMGGKQLMFRMISSEGNIDGHKWRNPDKLFSASDYQKAANAIGEIDKWDLEIFDDAGMTVNEIRAKAREVKRKYPDQDHLIIIDYLQLIRSAGKKTSENRQQEVSEISRSLKALARELDVPVIALSQLSRGVESRQDKRPMMSDIRESGSIEQDADVVAFLYRDDYYDKESENKNIVEIIIAKQRNGPVGTIETVFIKEYGKFVNLERRYGSVVSV